MGRYDDDGFDFEDEQPQTNKELREAYEALKKKFTKLETSHGDVLGKLSERNLKDVLAEKKVRPGLARAIKSDGVDASDPAAIESWLTDQRNQEDYAFSLDAPEAPPAEQQDEASELAEQYARLQGAGAGAPPVSPSLDAANRMKSADSQAGIQAALDAALAQMGAGGS